MKPIPAFTFATLLFLVGCGAIVRAFTAEPVSLQYVGTVQAGPSSTEHDVTHIPLLFTGGEWSRNSARVLKEIKANRHEYEIHFSVVTSVATQGGETVRPEIVIKGLRPGRYQLIYQNPDNTSVRLGTIEI